MGKYYLYGAGINCHGVIQFFGKDNIIAVIDGDETKWGRTIGGLTIVSLHEYLSRGHGEEIIITAFFERDSIAAFLEKQGIYHYYILLNMTIFKYLLNVIDVNPLIEMLKEMKIKLLNMLDNSYMIERNRLIIEIVSEGVICNPDQWINIILQRKPQYQNREIWNFWGLGYAFVALSNWE